MTHIKKLLTKRKMIWLTTLLMTLMVVGMVTYLSAEGEKEEDPFEVPVGLSRLSRDCHEVKPTFGA